MRLPTGKDHQTCTIQIYIATNLTQNTTSVQLRNQQRNGIRNILVKHSQNNNWQGSKRQVIEH